MHRMDSKGNGRTKGLGRTIAFGAVLASVACVLALTASVAAAAPPRFQVGTGVVGIDPTSPQYPAGYGYKSGPFTKVNDPLQARAFVVARGNKAVALVSVDSCGWFADYQGSMAGLGEVDARIKAAGELRAHGFDASRSSVLMSTTHVHAAPTLVGIWGPTRAAYLKRVHDAAIKAVAIALSNMKVSELWSATGNIRSIIWQNGQGTDHPDGFKVDSNTPILWARDPETGATNGLYVNVPVHADEYDGSENLEFSADWPGWVRADLDAEIGGTTVMAQGTLGRQETPGSDHSYSEVVHQGRFIANAIKLAMAHARPLTDGVIASDESYLRTLADNSDLLTAMNLNQAFPNACLDAEEICTIPRSVDPPYLSGGDEIGTYVTSLRIGGLVYFTNPGEAFPEVNAAVRDGIKGARSANPVGQAGDMLGYYYQRGDYTDEQFGSSDFETYNVGPDLAQDNADKAIENARNLGFTATAQKVHADFDASVADKPGIQFYPDELQSANRVVELYGATAKAQHQGVEPDGITWDFGDGTTGTSADSERFTHTFPGPGSYDVVATTTDSNGGSRSWTQRIVIDRPLAAKPSVTARSAHAAALGVGSSGGQGTLIAATWTCPDGSHVRGLTVVCPTSTAGRASVTVVDGAGNTASAAVSIPAPPPPPPPATVPGPAKLGIAHLRPRSKRVRAGHKVRFRIRLENSGELRARRVKVCVRLSKRARKRLRVHKRCRRPGSIAGGRAKTATIVIRARHKAKGKVKVRFRARSGNAGSAHARAKVKIKKRHRHHHGHRRGKRRG